MEDQTIEKSVNILLQYLEVGQSKGSYTISECAVLKRVVDFFDKSQTEKDPEINEPLALQLLCNAMVRANSKGAFTIADSALLDKTIRFVVETLNKSAEKGKTVEE